MAYSDTDYHARALETAQRARENQLTLEDWDWIIEELEEMARSERSEVENRAIVLLHHLLKWEYQPDRRSSGWRGTIKEQRQRIEKRLKTQPSLLPYLPEILQDAYEIALTRAVAETGKPESAFPATLKETGWTPEQVLNFDFYPGAEEPTP
jgi:hypothetical protein